MKIFILFMCLLAVAYATMKKNPKEEPKVKKEFELFCSYLKHCSKEHSNCIHLNLPFINLMNVQIWHCILKKAHVIDENDRVNKTRGVDYCKSIMHKEEDLEYCESCMAECIDGGCEKLGLNLKDWKESNCQIFCGISNGVMARIKSCNILMKDT